MPVVRQPGTAPGGATGMDIAQFLAAQNVPPDKIPIASGIVWAESRGNTTARSKPNRDGSIDRGMWQINDKAHPDVSDECADSPTCATQAAGRISNNWTDFTPWSTFKNGTALAARGKHFVIHAGDTSSGTVNDIQDAVTGVVKAPLDIAKAFAAFTKALFDPSTWARVGKGMLGAIIVVIGLSYMGAQALKPVAKTAKKLPIPVPV